MYVGKCGDNAWYTYNIYNTARIYGKGKVSLNFYENSDVLEGVLASYNTPTHLVPDKLKKVIIKKGITELDTAAFASYQNLEEIKLSNTVSLIGNVSFSHCNNLRKIDNLGNVNYIGSGAFMYCGNLKDIYMKGKSYANWTSSDDEFRKELGLNLERELGGTHDTVIHWDD